MLWPVIQSFKVANHSIYLSHPGCQPLNLIVPPNQATCDFCCTSDKMLHPVYHGILWPRVMMLFVGCLTSQQQASVSQGWICSDNFTCCHTGIEVADQTFYLTQSQYTDTRSTSPSADPITPGTWQGSHWSANFIVTGKTRPRKNPGTSRIRTRDLPLLRRTA